MASPPFGELLRHLRWRAGRELAGGLTDAELLRRFAGRRDEAAFEVLVWRHGPTVLGVCQRLLRHPQDAEDAFQATFLAFVRGAASIGRRDSVGSWLYRVAFRIGLKAKARAAQRARHGQRALESAADPPAEDVIWRDLRPVLDEEVNRLPERYRRCVILCYLNGKTCSEAAAELGCPRGTVVTWLARARQLLRRRLARRGLGLAAGMLAARLAGGAASASAPALLVRTTVEAGRRALSGRVLAGAASAQAVALTEEVLKAMFASKVKGVAAALVAAALIAGVGGTLARQGPGSGQPAPPKPAAEAKPPAKNEAGHWVGYDTRETDAGPELVVVSEDGTSTTYPAAADAAVIAYLADNAYGRIRVPLSVNLADTNRALVRFALPPAGTVRKAELVLRLTKDLPLVPPEPFTVGVHEVTAAWDEGTVTWANQPAFAARPAVTVRVDGAKELRADVTALVRPPAGRGAPRHGWLLKVVDPLPQPPQLAVPPATEDPKWVAYASREMGGGPELAVRADDGPAATYAAAADTVVVSYQPDLTLGRGPAWLSVDLADTNRVLLRFDLPPRRTVRKAELVLRPVKPEPGKPPIPLPAAPFELAIHEVTAAWDEGAVNWRSQPVAADKPALTATVDPKVPELRIDVTELVRRSATAGAPRHGWLLKVAGPAKQPPGRSGGKP
jgi:RNA polymerase sigma factor (sigma-70 family)